MNNDEAISCRPVPLLGGSMQASNCSGYRGRECLQESLIQANEEVDANQQLLSKIKSELKETTQQKTKLQTQQSELEKELKELMQDAEISKKQIDEDKLTMEQLEGEIKAKENAVAELDEKMNDLQDEKKNLEGRIEDQNKILIKKEGDLTSLKAELKEVLEREKLSYDKLDSMRKDFQLESSENAKLVEVIEYTRKDKQTLEQEIIKYKEETVQLGTKIKVLEDDMEVEKIKLQTVLDAKNALEKAKYELEVQNEKHSHDINKLLEEEKQQNQDLVEELEQLKKEKGNLEDKNKSLHGQTGGKTKQIKDLNQEIKTLKGKLTTITKQKASCEEGKNDLSKDFEALQADMEALKKEMGELSEKKEEAEKKEKLAVVAQEEQMKTFEQVMNTYKVDYDKIVVEKCSTIEDLKKKLSDQTSAKKDEENKRQTLEGEIEDLKKKMKDIESSKDTLEKGTSEKEEKITALEEQLKEKDQEISKLQEDGKKIEEKLAEAEKAAEAAKKKRRSPSPKRQEKLPKTGPMTPVTPTIRNKVQDKQSTPRTPLNRCPPTDDAASKKMRTPMTVKAVTPRTTPQRSILKQQNSAVRLKRSVAFAQDNEMEDDGASSDSSTSQLMEFELEEVEQRLKHSNTDRRVPSRAVTPMRIRPSPQINQIQPSSMGHVQRSLTTTNVKMMEENCSQKEKQLYGEPYPEIKTDKQDKKQKQTSQSNKNARKTPKRAYKIKGWGDSPRGRKKKKDAPAKENTENNLSWFENDAVYGFFD